MTTHEQWQLTMEAAELYERYPARYFLAPCAPTLVDAARLTLGERVPDTWLAGPASWLAMRRNEWARADRSSAST